jgi:hypothetical protein
MNASGAAKVTTFGTFVGNRYKNQGNIIWMAYGDADPATLTSSTSLEIALITAIKAAGANQLWGGHLPVSNGDPFDNATIAPYMNLRSIYAWTISSSNDSPEYTLLETASAWSPTAPAFFMDDDGYELDPDNAPSGDGSSTSANTVRKRKWWSLLSGIAGVTFGNFAMQVAGGNGTAAGGNGNPALTGTYAFTQSSKMLLSDGHKQFGVMANIMNAVSWWLMLPASVGGVGTLITSGGGTKGGQDWVAAAADPAGTLLMAYVPPAHTGSVTVAASIMAHSFTAYWIDPTSGAKTSIGTFSPGSQTFSTPGTNSYGSTDWVLLLE